MDRKPNKIPGANFIGMLPGMKSLPDAATLGRIYSVYKTVGRPLTQDEILLCFTPEGTA